MSLEFNISSDNGISIVSFKGKIVSDEHLVLLQKEISALNEPNAMNLIFDFGQLTHINSSGINFIIRSLTRSRIINRDLVLTSITGNVKTIFEIAKITEIFSIYATVSEAINHFKN
ncbi:MAG: hypothetical protein RL265_198 [Bacteroidota bacterium]|jgi:anti-sigma B factor antagonist